MIVSNTNKLNSIITKIEGSAGVVTVTKYDGSIEEIHLPSQLPDMNEADTSNLNFISNKRKKVNATFIESVDLNTLNKMDTVVLSDKSEYIFDGIKLVKTQKSIVELSESVRIPLYIENKIYRKKSIVSYLGNIYMSVVNTRRSPLGSISDWKKVSEYNAFANICEFVPKRLNALFVVSANNYAKTLISPSSIDEYTSIFNGEMVPQSSNGHQYLNHNIGDNSLSFTGWRSGFPQRVYSTSDDYIDETIKRITGEIGIQNDNGSGTFEFIGWNRNLGDYSDSSALTFSFKAINDSSSEGVPLGVMLTKKIGSKLGTEPFGYHPNDGNINFSFDIDMSVARGTTNLGIICTIDSSVNEENSSFHRLKDLILYKEDTDNE